MQYIDLKQNLINKLNELNQDLKDIEEYGIKTVINNKESMNKELELSKQVDKILKSLENVDIHNIDSDIHNGILELDILLNDKFNKKLFSNDEKLKNVFSSNIKELYFKSDLSLDEIFDEFQLSIRVHDNISNLEFDVYGYKNRLEEINELIKQESNNNFNDSKIKINKQERGIENDRELYY